MENLIGVILLIYGIAGVVGTLIVVGMLKQPVEKMRELLGSLSQHFDKGGDAALKASGFVNDTAPILQKIAEVLQKIVQVVRNIAKPLGDAANLLKSVESTLNAIKVPALAPQTKTMDLSLDVPVVTGLSLKEYEVLDFKLYGPPLTISTASVSLDIGSVTVITGLGLTEAYPLRPVGEAIGNAGDKVDQAHDYVNNTADRVEDMKERAIEAKETAEKTATKLRDLSLKLEDASKNLAEMSENKLLSLIPKLVLYYFGLIHFAFALIGLVFLF